VDRAGNTSVPSNIRTVDIETRTPRATIIRPASGAKTDTPIELLATTPDLDVNRVQFQFKVSTAIQWSSLGSPIVSAPFAVTWNPSGLPRGIYQFRAVATDVRGHTDSSPPVVSISFQEVVAPGAPSGVGVRVDKGTALLSWTAPAASDLKGYFVYRTAADGIDGRVSGLLTTTSFSDPDRPDGHYTYSVTAVDTSDNESSRSVVATAHVYTPMIVAPSSCAAEAATGLSGSGASPGSTVTVF